MIIAALTMVSCGSGNIFNEKNTSLNLSIKEILDKDLIFNQKLMCDKVYGHILDIISNNNATYANRIDYAFISQNIYMRFDTACNKELTYHKYYCMLASTTISAMERCTSSFEIK